MRSDRMVGKRKILLSFDVNAQTCATLILSYTSEELRPTAAHPFCVYLFHNEREAENDFPGPPPPLALCGICLTGALSTTYEIAKSEIPRQTTRKGACILRNTRD